MEDSSIPRPVALKFTKKIKYATRREGFELTIPEIFPVKQQRLCNIGYKKKGLDRGYRSSAAP
jgi:hypothetical protein